MKPSPTVTLTELAALLGMSLSWTQKNWRTLHNLPEPFIGKGKGQTPRWRRSELDAYLTNPEAVPSTPVNQKQLTFAAPPENTRLKALLDLAGAA